MVTNQSKCFHGSETFPENAQKSLSKKVSFNKCDNVVIEDILYKNTFPIEIFKVVFNPILFIICLTGLLQSGAMEHT